MMKKLLWIFCLFAFLTGCETLGLKYPLNSYEKKVVAGEEDGGQELPNLSNKPLKAKLNPKSSLGVITKTPSKKTDQGKAGTQIPAGKPLKGAEPGDSHLSAIKERGGSAKHQSIGLHESKDWYLQYIPMDMRQRMGIESEKTPQNRHTTAKLAEIEAQNQALQVKVSELQGKLKSYGGPPSSYRIPIEVKAKKEKGYTDINFGKYHALVIGNNDYTNLKKLRTAINDAQVISDLLKKKYGFTTKTISNGSRREIVSTLNHFRATLKKSDNFLIYYAGHGSYDEDTKTGYWQPVNALEKNDVDWIPNDTVTRIIKGIKANNVMVVADSCYSGTVFRGSGQPKLSAESTNQYLKRMVEKKTRVALTSGGNEPVADSIAGDTHSAFAKAFINILRENKGALTASRLSEDLKREVIPIMESYQVQQTPEFSDLHTAGHDGGDFVFVPQQLIGS